MWSTFKAIKKGLLYKNDIKYYNYCLNNEILLFNWMATSIN
jgi:hypothetical protein